VPEVLQHRLWDCHRIAMQDGLVASNFGLDQPPCQVDTPAAVGLGRVLSLPHLHVFVGRPVRMPYYHAPLERERERERDEIGITRLHSSCTTWAFTCPAPPRTAQGATLPQATPLPPPYPGPEFSGSRHRRSRGEVATERRGEGAIPFRYHPADCWPLALEDLRRLTQPATLIWQTDADQGRARTCWAVRKQRRDGSTLGYLPHGSNEFSRRRDQSRIERDRHAFA
jgi:hypothetical protein